ncbi:hypothetical protein IDM40_27205 [Nocardiopsis sp. HNM0947]|uniref:Cupin domain-containing protein n=1 Tax=Nocardiopsis coralli TaxID=2772213 RepID=A0ABR9PEV5_9ACTN|nr:hypothetical protein [Nocardiopsis coralli]
MLPEQGSFEVQQDGPGKTHGWHRHSIHETLAILSGTVELFWRQDGTTHTAECGPGSRISLPAHTEHGSTAGPEGCVYVIAPEGGRTAETTFL